MGQKYERMDKQVRSMSERRFELQEEHKVRLLGVPARCPCVISASRRVRGRAGAWCSSLDARYALGHAVCVCRSQKLMERFGSDDFELKPLPPAPDDDGDDDDDEDD